MPKIIAFVSTRKIPENGRLAADETEALDDRAQTRGLGVVVPPVASARARCSRARLKSLRRPAGTCL